MQETPPTLTNLDQPTANLGTDHLDFLQRLARPTQISIKGADPSRCRAIVTLLHGNEPSGLKAVHRLLKEDIVPATDLVIIIASVNAALHPPLLSHRFLPWERDLNRCFADSGSSAQGSLASGIMGAINARTPEAVIDAHNTSAHSEPFAVALQDTAPTRALSSMFARNLVVMDQTLGTLMDRGDPQNPWITVEFGGLMDPAADRLAFESLRDFVTRKHLFDLPPAPLRVLHHPFRLEIAHDARIHYASSVIHDSHITMFNTIDQLNFQHVDADTPLGWLSPDGLARFRIRSNRGDERIEDYFYNSNGFLTTVRPLTLFMATTDPYIAQKDCLLYLAPTAPTDT